MDYKVLPNNLESEQSVLGCVLLDQDAQMDILTTLKPDDFYSESHKKIFGAMQKIFSKNIPVDFVTLTNELEVEKKLDEVGGIDYVTFLTNSVPSAANFRHYVDIVLSNAVRRNLIKAGQKIVENTFETADEKEAMQSAEKIVFDLSQNESGSDLELVGKPGGTLTRVLSELSFLAENQGRMRGLPTGFRDFDALTNGLQKSALIILAARPGVGKTSFAMNIATHVAVEENKKVAVFALEMSGEQLMQRSLASLAKVNLSKVLNGTMDQEEWKRVWTAEKKLAQSGLYLCDSSVTTPLDIISKCRKLKMTEGLDLIVIDYLQLMSSGKSNRENRTQEITEITRMLKVTAKELDVPIILLSQLSRMVEQREDHRPVLSDLRESGSIEQDADIVMFLYNPEKYNDVMLKDEPGTVYLLVQKHRSGATGEIKLKWLAEITTYTNAEQTKMEENE